METQRVWDYAGDNYVHRLIQSKTDGKLVELNSHCAHADDSCGSCDCSIDSAFTEAVLNSKVEAVKDFHLPSLQILIFLFYSLSDVVWCCVPILQIVNEYNDLLATQLENQRIVSASNCIFVTKILSVWLYVCFKYPLISFLLTTV